MVHSNKSNYKVLIVIFLVSFVLRLFMAFYYYNYDKHSLTSGERRPFLFGPYSTSEIIPDIDRYDSTAKHIAFYKKIIQSDTRLPSIPPPLYPLFLAIFYILFGYNVYAFLLPNISLAAINSILVFFLAQHLFNNKRISLIASLFYACNPHFLLTAIQPYSETPYFFLLLSLFLTFKTVLAKLTVKNIMVASLFMALAVLCRSIFLWFIPFIFAWLIGVFFRQKKKMLIITFGVFLPFCLICSLWIIRNYKIHNRILLSINFCSPWQANRPLEEDKYWEYLNKYKSESSAFINWVKNNPRQYLRLCKERLILFLFKGYAEGVSFRNKVVSSLIFYTVFPLGYLGIIVEVIKKKRLPLLILLYILSTTVLHIFTVVDGELRHRLPIELFMGIFACYGFGVIVNLWKRFTTLHYVDSLTIDKKSMNIT